jgi:glycosyltransferase involved in cell wall biosynthesis
MYRFEMTPERPLIYFVKLARFSNTNAYVEAQLRAQFPEATVRTLDVKSVFKRPSWSLFTALLAALLSLGRDRIAGRRWTGKLADAVVHRLLRSPAMFSAMSAMARRAVERERAHVWFTIQTQSLWNAAVRGIPHFVYTDSTVLANLYFKHRDFACLPPATWLERESTIYADAAKTFVMSEHVGRSLTELYGIEPARVARVCVGANLRRPPESARPAPRDNRTILFVGMEWERKGGPELAAAFARVRERYGDARLLIVGASPRLDAPGCEVIGRVPADRVPEYYAQAAIFCMPTRLEPFGIAFIEAMMHAVAVAAPGHGAMLDYVRDRETGVLYEPGDAGDIARALLWLLDHPAERQAIALRGLEAVRSAYTWDAVGRRLRAGILSSLEPAEARPDPRGTFRSCPRLFPDREPAG